MTSRCFTLQDQLDFAQLSGDSNPLHIDPLTARRTQFGRPIVHGMHLLLWALEQMESPPLSIKKLKCSLRAPVGINETVICHVTENTSTTLKIQLECRGAEIALIVIEPSPANSTPVPSDEFPAETECRHLIEDEVAVQQGSLLLMLNRVAFAKLFPKLFSIFSLYQAALLLATTRLVGMKCPGLNSIYSQLTFDLSTKTNKQGETNMEWKVKDYDDRFRRITLTLTAEYMTGEIIAMLRPEPQKQANMADLKRRLHDKDIFSSQNALVIGASRGLGELCAKILAAGGAKVRITYNQGITDAQAAVSDILAGGGIADCVHYNVLSPTAVLDPSWIPTDIYYFSTPPIFVAARNKFSEEIFNQFCHFYVQGLNTIWQKVRDITKQKIKIYYPSTVAVELPFPDMGEYAAAKSAGESLCRHLAIVDRDLQVIVKRLPRLPSDQTLSIMDTETEDPFKIMLDFICQK